MIEIIKRTISLLTTLSILACITITACATTDYDWAKTEIKYCQDNGIIAGDEHGELNPGGTLTRAEMSKMLVEAFDIPDGEEQSFDDINLDDWYYPYANAIKVYMTVPGNNFYPNEAVTREEFASTLVSASGLKPSALCNLRILTDNFKDADKVTTKYKTLLSIAVERGYYRGSDYYLRPTDTLKRAEDCAMLYRVLE